KAYWGDTVQISGRLITSRGAPLSGRIVMLYLDGIYVTFGITDSSGTFSFTYQIPEGATTGPRTFEVRFDGDRNYLPAQGSVTIIIPSFLLYTSPRFLRIPVGGYDYVSVYVVDSYGYDKPVRVVVKNAPSWLKIKYLGSSEGYPTFRCNILFSPKIAGRAYVEIVAIGDDGQEKSTTVRVISYFEPSFEISVTPFTQSTLQGGSAVFNVTIKPINGYSGKIYLSLLASNLQALAEFSSNPVYVSSSTVELSLMVKVDEKASPSIYELKVEGNDGSIVRQSNNFYLNVLEAPQPIFDLKVYPKNQSVPIGESVKYYVNVTSINNFTGYVQLEIENPPINFNFTFSENPVLLNPNEFKLILLTVKVGEGSEMGYYNLTLTASSVDYTKTDHFGVTVIKYPAKVELYYIHWPTRKWLPEDTFLPFEAVGVLVNYTPNNLITIEFPDEIVYPKYNSSIQVYTNSSGLAQAVFLLNGPYGTFGVYNITVRNNVGEIIGKTFITIDGASLSYTAKNYFSQSILIFNITWATSGRIIKNRGGTLEVELILPSNISLRSPPVLDNGSIIMYAPYLDVEAHLPARLCYAGSSVNVYENSTSIAECLVHFRSVAAHLLSSNCSDFYYQVKVQTYYRYTLEPASNITVALLAFDEEGTLLAIVKGSTNDVGIIDLVLNVPFIRHFQIKLLCADSSEKWVTCCKWADTTISIEDVSVIISAHQYKSVIMIKLASLCSLMDLSCNVHITVYDYAMQPKLNIQLPIIIHHGEIELLPVNVGNIDAAYLEVEVSYNGVVISRVLRKIGGA
ncbi:MAG: hypothetical protein DRJ26_03285, partial [Candidatus Methanomethylicota archaeon]